MYGYMGHKSGLPLNVRSVELLIHRCGSVSGMEWCFLHQDIQEVESVIQEQMQTCVTVFDVT